MLPQQRRRASDQGFRMLNLESCGVVNKDDNVSKEVNILYWKGASNNAYFDGLVTETRSDS